MLKYCVLRTGSCRQLCLISSAAGGYNSIVLFAFTLYFLFHSTFILKNCVYPQVVAVNDGIEYYD